MISKGATVILDYLRKFNRAKWTAKLDLSCNGLTYVPLEVTPKPSTINPQPLTLNPQPYTLHPEP